ncbi:PucR family transcriptional regulator ligand-binding domain-containing protein [Nocardioides sp. NPDC127503]|uniref:PucR family transcriptional regulator n=1 Tax=Nocardioides sp. NPDC127503 TaxID=3154516 RepID=UPI003328EE04
MGLVTVSRVLDMPVIRTAAPEVVAGRDGLDREVRWVHSAELAEIGALLRGGDLLLSTGIALPGDAAGLSAFADSLAESDAAGLFIELGRRWSEIPSALTARCDELGLPLIALGHEVRFAAVAQAVGERIVDEQLADLREAQRVHDTFTELSMTEAGQPEILQAAQRLCAAAVVLEDDQQRVLDYRSGPDDIDAFLHDWTTRSRRVPLEGRSAWDETNRWLVTRVGRRDRGWGRLIVQSDQRPSPGLVATAERAAAALAMHRLNDGHRDSLVRRTHHELLVALLNDPSDPDLLRRCELAGLPIRRRQFIAETVRPVARPADRAGGTVRADEIVAAITHTLSARELPGLVGIIGQDVRILLSLPLAADADHIADELAEAVTAKHAATVAAARPVEDSNLIDRTLRESQQVMDALKPDQLTTISTRPHRLEDAHLRGLLTLLAGDDRLALYADRELRALDAHDDRYGTDLLGAVRALVTSSGKSEAAASLHISRPVFYDRLAKAARVTGTDLDDPDIRVSLHVALLYRELLT